MFHKWKKITSRHVTGPILLNIYSASLSLMQAWPELSERSKDILSHIGIRPMLAPPLETRTITPISDVVFADM